MIRRTNLFASSLTVLTVLTQLTQLTELARDTNPREAATLTTL